MRIRCGAPLTGCHGSRKVNRLNRMQGNFAYADAMNNEVGDAAQDDPFSKASINGAAVMSLIFKLLGYLSS